MPKPNLTKVTMNLTDTDIKNAEFLLSKLNERNQASVVSKSLSLTKDLVEIIEGSSKLLIETDGVIKELKIIGLVASR
ncbi:MAG: hypothetical protein ACR2PT_23745 [Endozoicomonas sp.]